MGEEMLGVNESKFLSQEQLAVRCRYWQALLGLAHWNIDVRVVRGAEIEDNRGRIDYDPVGEAAVMRLKDPMDYQGYFPCDLEETIVHELLHLIFDKSTTGGDEYEQALDRTARVLVSLDRQKERGR